MKELPETVREIGRVGRRREGGREGGKKEGREAGRGGERKGARVREWESTHARE